MNLIALFVLIGVLLGFVALIMNLPEDEITPYNEEAMELITKFTKSGEYIAFDRDPLPPVTKYVYEAKEVIVPKKLENGTVVNQTETISVPVPAEDAEPTEQNKQTTTLSVTVEDRKLNQPKVCKLGYQCDITGTIVLIDPVTNKKIPPPYSYLLTIDCDFRDFCNLITLSSNEVTFPDGTFKYTWVPTNPVQPGEFKATVYVTSHYTNEDGENKRRLAERDILVVQ